MICNDNFWNKLPFHSGAASANMWQYYKSDLEFVFKGDGKVYFSKWFRQFELAVEATPHSDVDSLARLQPNRLGGAAFSYWDNLSENYVAVKD